MDFMDWGPGHVVQFVWPRVCGVGSRNDNLLGFTACSPIQMPALSTAAHCACCWQKAGTKVTDTLTLLPFPAYTDRCCAKLQSVICQPEEGFRHNDEIKC